MSVDADYIATLETENDLLREKVAALEEIIGLKINVPLIFGLTAHEAKLFGVLLKRELVSKDTAMTALYGLRADVEEVEIKIIDVFICKIRKKLESFGITIETVWGQGYRLSAQARDKANSYLEKADGVSA
jgi:two-component system cell cycle response regulator CtrA